MQEGAVCACHHTPPLPRSRALALVWVCITGAERRGSLTKLTFHSATTPRPTAHRLQDVGPHTWSVLTAGYPLESTPLPFYAQPPSHVAATKGQEPPLRIR